MKNRINLFKRKPKLDYISANGPKFKRYLTVAGIFLFVLFLFLISQSLGLNAQQQNLLKSKETYLRYLLTEKDIEANMRYFKSKQTQVNTFLKDDAQFLPYYQVLKQSLAGMNDESILEVIDIDKDRKTRFVVKFSKGEEMLAFLKYIEGEDFLKNFVTLSLQNFNLNQQQARGNSYQLELQGVFKEIKTQ